MAGMAAPITLDVVETDILSKILRSRNKTSVSGYKSTSVLRGILPINRFQRFQHKVSTKLFGESLIPSSPVRCQKRNGDKVPGHNP